MRAPRKSAGGKGANPWSAAGRGKQAAKDAAPKAEAKVPAQPKARKPRAKKVAATNVVAIGSGKKPARKKRAAHRPTLMTPEVQSKLLASLQVGATLPVAATYAGVSYRSVLRWLERGRIEEARMNQAMVEDGDPAPLEDEDAFWQFWRDAEVAMASMEVVSLTTIRSAMTNPDAPWPSKVKAAIFYAERRVHGYQPKRYESIELTGQAGAPIQVELTPDEEQDRDRQIIDVMLATGALAALTEGEDEDG